MNRVFTHAEGDLDVTVAYYAASQMVAFTAEQFGFAEDHARARALGRGQADAGRSSARRSASRRRSTTRDTARGSWRASPATRASTCST